MVRCKCIVLKISHDSYNVYIGTPPSPTNLVASVNSDRPKMLDISWSSPPFIPGAPVKFRINITSITLKITSEVVEEEHYVFDAGSGFQTYLIQVEAVNPAGSSPAAELLAILPPTSQRDIPLAQVSLYYTVEPLIKATIMMRRHPSIKATLLSPKCALLVQIYDP